MSRDEVLGSPHFAPPSPSASHHQALVDQVLIATGLFFPPLSKQRSNTDRIVKLSQYRGENIQPPSSLPPTFLFHGPPE